MTAPKQTQVIVEGIDEQQVGQVASNIRDWRRPGALQGQGHPLRRRVHLPQGRQEEVRAQENGTEQERAVPEAPPAHPEQAARPGRRASAPVGPPQQQEHPASSSSTTREGRTLASASSLEKDLGVVGKNNVEAAAKIGAAIAERAKKAGIEECYFDRGGFLFHGKHQGAGRRGARGRPEVLNVQAVHSVCAASMIRGRDAHRDRTQRRPAPQDWRPDGKRTTRTGRPARPAPRPRREPGIRRSPGRDQPRVARRSRAASASALRRWSSSATRRAASASARARPRRSPRRSARRPSRPSAA